MTGEPRPEVVQALVSAWTGADPAALDDLTDVTAAERRAASALVAAVTALETPPTAQPQAAPTHEQILRAVDELD